MYALCNFSRNAAGFFIAAGMIYGFLVALMAVGILLAWNAAEFRARRGFRSIVRRFRFSR